MKYWFNFETDTPHHGTYDECMIQWELRIFKLNYSSDNIKWYQTIKARGKLNNLNLYIFIFTNIITMILFHEDFICIFYPLKKRQENEAVYNDRSGNNELM